MIKGLAVGKVCDESIEEIYAEVNSISKAEAVAITKKYNSERLPDDPLFSPCVFTNDESYRVELFADGSLIGLAAFELDASRAAPTRKGERIKSMPYLFGVTVGAVFVINEYRSRVIGGQLGLVSAWAVSEILKAKLYKLIGTKPKANVIAFIEAVCVSRGGRNFCNGVTEHFQEMGDFSDMISGKYSKYQCNVQLNTLELDDARTLKMWA